MADDAATTDDPVEAATFAALAPQLRRQWRCPHDDYAPDPDLLDEECREVLAAVARLTTARCVTCPLAGPRLPWVQMAAEARVWAERGHLDLYHPDPPHVLVDAISLIDAGIGLRQQCEVERAKRPLPATDDTHHE